MFSSHTHTHTIQYRMVLTYKEVRLIFFSFYSGAPKNAFENLKIYFEL